MQPEIRTWLYDIQVNIEEIEMFINEKSHSFETYKDDVKTRRAAERNLGIIGEAVNRILSLNRDIAITDARKIVDTRNRIVHGYERVSNEIIWDIVKNSLPSLNQKSIFY